MECTTQGSDERDRSPIYEKTAEGKRQHDAKRQGRLHAEIRNRPNQVTARVESKHRAVQYPRYIGYQAACEYCNERDPDRTECANMDRNVRKCIRNVVSPDRTGHNRISRQPG